MAAPSSLQSLVEDGIIDEVERQLMSGKEAAVYVVRYRGERVAAKVYKAREQRTFKANAAYTEGRNQTRNTRDKRAMSKRSSYGRELSESSWRDMEYSALWSAAHAGVRVPKPIMLYEDVLLMELLVDADEFPARRLADFDIAPEDAEALHLEIFTQVRLLLGTGKVHGDLSAFNILMAKAGPTLIDLPQVVDAAQNNMAGAILRRDLENVTEHLARFDARLLRFRSCGEGLWRAFQQGALGDATHPQVGGVRGERASGGRRAALAESGRLGREGRRPQGPGPFDRGAPRGAGPQQERPRAHEPQRDTQRAQKPQHAQQRAQHAPTQQRTHTQHPPTPQQHAPTQQRTHTQHAPTQERTRTQHAQPQQRTQHAPTQQRTHTQHAPTQQQRVQHAPTPQQRTHTQHPPTQQRTQHAPTQQQRAQHPPTQQQRTHTQHAPTQQGTQHAPTQQRTHEPRRDAPNERPRDERAPRDEQQRQGRRGAPVPVDYVRRSYGRPR